MTKETLDKAKDILNGINWADKVIEHIVYRHRLSFRFDTTRDCIENHEMMVCPNWLEEIIEDAIRSKRDEWRKEFDEL